MRATCSVGRVREVSSGLVLSVATGHVVRTDGEDMDKDSAGVQGIRVDQRQGKTLTTLAESDDEYDTDVDDDSKWLCK